MPTPCAHCHGDIEIRNPTGFCDHLYYPDNCAVCQAQDLLADPEAREAMGEALEVVQGLLAVIDKAERDFVRVRAAWPKAFPFPGA